MKTKQLRSSKPLKFNKRASETETDYNRVKSALQKNEDQYLSPMHIKIPKNKLKCKKQQKTSKINAQFQQKTTKRKEKKKAAQECNGNLMLNDNMELIQTIKYDKALLKLKAKNTEKTFRNSSKNNISEKCQFTEEVSSPKILTKTNQSQKKPNSSKIDANIPQEEYLFIGDEFYLINNYYPTKRLLNTFREVCLQENVECKFTLQDKNQKNGKQKLDFKRNNIFVAARKEIEMKNKVQKIVVLQRWWRRMIEKHNLHEEKSNPEMMQFNTTSPVKYNFESFDQMNSITPIKPYLDDFGKDAFDAILTPKRDGNSEEIEIISFNSADMMEEKPKKIEFKQQDLSKMLMRSYKLPQNNEVDHTENDEIFNRYAQFKIAESEPLNNSTSYDSSENMHSPKKDDVYPHHANEPTNEQDKQQSFDLLREFQQATKIKELIDKRIIFQKGQTKSLDKSSKIGISTSILSIHNMLVNFFHFYINKYRDQFLSLINMPYGYSINSRLRAMAGKPLPQQMEEDDSGILYGLQYIVDDDKLEEYFKFIEMRDNKMCSSFSKANFELEKIHFKAILDYFNQQLNEYRPYRQINGIPYPWNHSYKALTFYFVNEENIAEVFEKAELKVLKSTSLLCGIIIPELQSLSASEQDQELLHVDAFMQQYQKNNNGLILEHNDTREVKMIHEQVKNQQFQPDFESFSGVIFEISNEVMNSLIFETVLQIHGLVFQEFIY